MRIFILQGVGGQNKSRHARHPLPSVALGSAGHPLPLTRASQLSQWQVCQMSSTQHSLWFSWPAGKPGILCPVPLMTSSEHRSCCQALWQPWKPENMLGLFAEEPGSHLGPSSSHECVPGLRVPMELRSKKMESQQEKGGMGFSLHVSCGPTLEYSNSLVHKAVDI